MRQYFNEQGADAHHPDKLLWPGTAGGLPVLGRTSPLLRQDEYESLPVRPVYRCRQFDFSKDDDLKEFQYVMERIAVGWFRLVHITRFPDMQGNRMTGAWVEWNQLYGFIPEETGRSVPSFPKG